MPAVLSRPGWRARGASTRPSRLPSLLRWLAVSLLAAVVAVSFAVVCMILYGDGVHFTVAGVGFRSTHPFRPIIAGIAAWFALGHLAPRLRTSREGLVILGCLAAYAWGFDMSHVPSGDAVPSEYGALSIATGRGLSLEGYPELLEEGTPYFLRPTNLGLRSEFATGPELIAWPLYLPAALSSVPRPSLVHRLGNSSALLVGLACVALAMRVAARLAPSVSPRLLGLAYGVGTLHWSTSATGFGQHGPGELWMLAALDRLLDEDTSRSRRLVALGFALTLAVFTRPPLGLSAFIIAGLTFYRYRFQALTAYLAAAAIALPLVHYNVDAYGSILGAYTSRSYGMSVKPPGELARQAWWLIASPNRGDFWFEPIVLATLAVGLVVALRRRASLTLYGGLTGYLTVLLSNANYSLWWGGYSFGPRYMVDALPWWILVFASLGPLGSTFRRAVVALGTVGILVNVAGLKGNPALWDSLPSVDFYRDRLLSFGDSQIEFAALSALPRTRVRLAIEAEARGDLEEALALWTEDFQKHPWRRYSGYRVANLLLRNDRVGEAHLHADALARRWPDSRYSRDLARFLPPMLGILRNDAWRKPTGVVASRNDDLSGFVNDRTLDTRWGTLGPQRRGDWLELSPPRDTLVRGVAVFSMPDFGNEPAGLELVGTTTTGEVVELGVHETVRVPRKGWVAMRFAPVELSCVKLVVTEDKGSPWSVSEARLLLLPKYWPP